MDMITALQAHQILHIRRLMWSERCAYVPIIMALYRNEMSYITQAVCMCIKLRHDTKSCNWSISLKLHVYKSLVAFVQSDTCKFVPCSRHGQSILQLKVIMKGLYSQLKSINGTRLIKRTAFIRQDCDIRIICNFNQLLCVHVYMWPKGVRGNANGRPLASR